MSEVDDLPLFRRPPARLRRLARNPDRATSVAAAEGVEPALSELQQRVYDYLKSYGPATDEQINMAFAQAYPNRYAESTVRHRRSDLTARGLAVPDGESQNARGQRVTVWRARGDP